MIDDDPVIRMVVREALLSCGYAVLEAGDAEEGQRIAHDARPALIILDIMLPRVDGLSLLAEMKAAGVRSDVLVFSATGSKSAERALALGAAGYLSKPFDLRELTDTVAGILRGRDVA